MIPGSINMSAVIYEMEDEILSRAMVPPPIPLKPTITKKPVDNQPTVLMDAISNPQRKVMAVRAQPLQPAPGRALHNETGQLQWPHGAHSSMPLHRAPGIPAHHVPAHDESDSDDAFDYEIPDDDMNPESIRMGQPPAPMTPSTRQNPPLQDFSASLVHMPPPPLQPEDLTDNTENIYGTLTNIGILHTLPKERSLMSIAEVTYMLKALNLHRYIKAFEDETMDGELLMDMSESILKDTFNFKEFEVKKLMKFIGGWSPN